MFLITFFIPTNIHAQNFEVWVEAPPIFTIAKTESVNVYVKNLQAGVDDNYTVTFEIPPPGAPHLIDVHIPYDRTKTLKEGDVGGILARITLLGPVDPGSKIRFIITPDSLAAPQQSEISIVTGTALNLPEFELIGLIQLLILASLLLVISYSSHFR